jgi:hypothetical protein
MSQGVRGVFVLICARIFMDIVDGRLKKFVLWDEAQGAAQRTTRHIA